LNPLTIAAVAKTGEEGWGAAIYAPGSASVLPDSPVVLEKVSKDEIIVEAKEIIDALLNK
jgi:hypothetical protein